MSHPATRRGGPASGSICTLFRSSFCNSTASSGVTFHISDAQSPIAIQIENTRPYCPRRRNPSGFGYDRDAPCFPGSTGPFVGTRPHSVRPLLGAGGRSRRVRAEPTVDGVKNVDQTLKV